MDGLARRDVLFQRIQEAVLVPVALHVATDTPAVQHIERGEKRGGAVSFVVVGQGAAATTLQRQSRLSAVQGLDLLVEREHYRMGGRRHIEADDVVQLLGEGRIVHWSV